MKKNKTKDQEQNRKPRRFSLSRETILLLDDPALLELARGADEPGTICNTGSSGPVESSACYR